MSGSREQHSAEMDALLQQLEELMGFIGAMKDKVEECEGLAAAAIGDSPTESGMIVRAWLAQLKDVNLDEVLRMAVNIQAEAQRYSQGF